MSRPEGVWWRHSGTESSLSSIPVQQNPKPVPEADERDISTRGVMVFAAVGIRWLLQQPLSSEAHVREGSKLTTNPMQCWRSEAR